MKLYTRTGDEGDTSLADESRVGKDHPRPAACGALDELNANLGLARSGCRDEGLCERIAVIQEELFIVGCEAALVDRGLPDRVSPSVTDDMVARLEGWIDEATAAVPPLSKFVLPAGDESACRLHVARTVCRRAERDLTALARTDTVSAPTRRYVNRLSDLLFAWARQVNHAAGAGDATVDFDGKP